jgi:ubiquinone biosynthesis protein COQ9
MLHANSTDTRAARFVALVFSGDRAMLDDMTNRSKIIKAALALAEERGWSSIGLPDIAGKTGMTMAELRKEFGAKTAILDAFRRETDYATLAQTATTTMGDGPRDRLFDVLMTRFELLLPYRPALRRIAADLRERPGELSQLIYPALNTQYWMLQAAGIPAEGAANFPRILSLMATHTQVFQVWLDDEDPAMAQTMAALDRRLRRAEQIGERLNTLCDMRNRLFGMFSMRRSRSSAPRTGGGPIDDAPPAPPAPETPPQGPAGPAPNGGQTI